MNFHNIKKGMFLSLFIAVLVYIGLSIYSDFHKLIEVLVSFNLKYLPILLLLAPLNYFFRYIKWSYYLKLVNVHVSTKDNVFIFMSGLAMTITPGKIGEFLKSYLLKRKVRAPISHTAPLIIGERLTDGISTLILASIGAIHFHYGKEILGLVCIAVIAFIAIMQCPTFVYGCINLLSRFKFLEKFSTFFKNFYEKMALILKIKPLLYAISIGMVSWFFEGLVIFVAGCAIGIDIPILSSIFIVCFSALVGGISMMPGGLLVAEGSIVTLLILMGLDKNMATFITLITRFSTFWLGVSLGVLGLLKLRYMFSDDPKKRL